jgi:hypothetical protein
MSAEIEAAERRVVEAAIAYRKERDGDRTLEDVERKYWIDSLVELFDSVDSLRRLRSPDPLVAAKNELEGIYASLRAVPGSTLSHASVLRGYAEDVQRVLALLDAAFAARRTP